MIHRIVLSAAALLVAAVALASCVSGGSYSGPRVGGMVREHGHADPEPIDF